MVRVTIDNHEVHVPDGTTLLDAARTLDIDIPTLCFQDGHPAQTSCMVCMVKLKNPDRFMPSCGTPVFEGMEVESDTEEVRNVRKTALELMLSEHGGDCSAPCHRVCPTGLNIPLMIRQVKDGELDQAIQTIKKDIALPAVLGRICSAPCENACRRDMSDRSVSICLLQRYVSDWDLEAEEPYLPDCKPDKPQKVAIIGAGPAGLAAAYHLRQEGFACSVYDSREQAGGSLLDMGDEDPHLNFVIENEIELIEKLGVVFHLRTKVGEDISWDLIQQNHDAVLVCAGKTAGDAVPDWLAKLSNAAGVDADRKTSETKMRGVFAAGSAVKFEKAAVRAMAQGKQAASSITQYLLGENVTGIGKEFSTLFRLKANDIQRLLAFSKSGGRVEPSGGHEHGFASAEADDESMRCLQCGCSSVSDCKLREYSLAYSAESSRFTGQRKEFSPMHDHPDVHFNSGLCILCGLCAHIAKEEHEELGLAITGRGYKAKLEVPFGRPLKEGLTKSARACVKACPTGALSFRKK